MTEISKYIFFIVISLKTMYTRILLRHMGFFRTNPVGAPMVVQKLRPKIYSKMGNPLAQKEIWKLIFLHLSPSNLENWIPCSLFWTADPWTPAWRRQRVDEVMKILAISNSMEVIQIQEDSDLSLCAEPIVHLFQGLRLLCCIFFNKFIHPDQ